MKNFLIIFVLSVMPAALFSQELGSLNFIHGLDVKEKTTYEDAAAFFVLNLDKTPGKFEENIDTLAKLSKVGSMGYGKEKMLTRGMLSKMIARYLGLKDSLLYLILRNERYAFKACAAEGIMENDQSEWDTLSGRELIEIMTIVQEKKGEKK